MGSIFENESYVRLLGVQLAGLDNVSGGMGLRCIEARVMLPYNLNSY